MNTPSREIYWNVSHPANEVVMYLCFAAALLIGLSGIWRRIELWNAGGSSPEHSGKYLTKIYDFINWVLLQHGTVRERGPAVAHTLIYLGFSVLLFTTTMVAIDHDLGINIYQGNFYLWITVLSDFFGAGLLIGVMLMAHRRYIKKLPQLHSKPADFFALSSLALLIVQGFLLEGLRIYVTKDQWRHYSPIGLATSGLFWPLSMRAASNLHFFIWWFHTLTVFAIIAIAPYTKFHHLIASSVNLFFRSRSRPAGALPFPGDLQELIEKSDELKIGLNTIKDYSWKQLLDLDACTSCGRCQAACPAFISGKPLSPKWIILDTRNHALALQSQGKFASASYLPNALKTIDANLVENLMLASSGVHKIEGAEDSAFDAKGQFRANNPLVQNAVRKLGADADARIAGEVIDSQAFWSCTTCMACVEACPVGINHVDQIVENRRAMVLLNGEIPHEAQKTLRALETQANPYGDAQDRIKWLTDLNVRILKAGDEVDYLYWVGCVSAYDPRKQKIARALVTLMNSAGLSFGILGTAEGCTGDPARRLGEENLFQTLAKSNIETLCSIKFKTLVANCPHCFNTIKNEYPQLGNLGPGRKPEIIHHSVLLKRMLAMGKLNLKAEQTEQSFTFHDPCYLGRYNQEYDAPREVVSKSSALPIIEMGQSREKGLCCGAGGGHFWMDIKVGERVNSIRVDQAAETGAKNVATACPFCLQMIEDGIKLTHREESMQAKDIAEVLVERLA